MEKNFYDILELSENDRKLQGEEFDKILKANYKKLARQWHPDKFSTKSEKEKSEAEDKFKEISEAYNTLSDPQKRQEYDFGNMEGGFDPFSGFNPFDIFGNRQNRTHQQIYKGQNITIEVGISLEEAYNGGEKEIKYTKKTMCGHCNGTGSDDGKTHTCTYCNGTGMISDVQQRGNMRMVSSHPCPHCNGTGRTFSKPCSHCNGEGMENVEIKEKIIIPAGVADGMYHTFKGKGCDLPKGYNGVSGDLTIVFRINKHPYFIVEPQFKNLKCNLDIDVIDLMLGCEREIKCIDGSTVNIKIPELTENNHVFVIKGKGMPVLNTSDYGNLKVVVDAKMPKKLSNKQRELLKKFKNS